MSDPDKVTMEAFFGRQGPVQHGRVGPPEPSMTSEECVAHGGHCHQRTGLSRASLPPQHEEWCKHCGHIRWAIPQDPYRYEEDRAR